MRAAAFFRIRRHNGEPRGTWKRAGVMPALRGVLAAPQALLDGAPPPQARVRERIMKVS
jgi:hypothetical protein